jgi:hypothetical protein
LETPALIHAQPDEVDEDRLVLPPPANGTRIRVIDFPPEGEAIRYCLIATILNGFDIPAPGVATPDHEM